MRPHRLFALAVALLMTAACGDDGGGGSPTTPSGPPSNPQQQTRVIHIDGDLNFGDVLVGSTVQKTLRVFNNGNSNMNVTGLRGPADMTANWTQGTIGPNGAFQDINIRFTPTEPRSYDGTFTIDANHTSGTNTKPVTARGIREIFRRSGVGNTVFDMPPGITRLRITGNPGSNCQNFIVRVGGRLVVNEILGTCSVADARTYDAIHVVSGTVVEIVSSTGVAWTFEEIR